jgi:DnaK suppressor protein
VTREDLIYFEELLRRERARIVEELGALGEGMKSTQRDSSGDLSAYSVHMADQATDSMEREKSFYIASIEEQALGDIDAALERVGQGAYGACELCSGEIARERLEALPGARFCIACQEKSERDARNGAIEH